VAIYHYRNGLHDCYPYADIKVWWQVSEKAKALNKERTVQR
jgi:hypothetical protein